MYDEGSPVVQRLLEGADEGAKSAAHVLLFCRLPGEPYVCCGRLGYVSHNPGRRPIKFVWALRDVDRLRGSEHFQALLGN